jgi:glyoxylase-like metal-dependent hydrolase (beta-lactamase superfamily II)
MDAYGMENAAERDQWRDFFIHEMGFRPRRPTRFIQDGDIIEVGDEAVEVISTPGHTAGHLAFFFRNSGVLFMGDYALTSFGPWYGDINSSIEETISSLKRLRSIRARIWLTSHETGVFEANPGDAWDRYMGIIAEREERLLSLLKRPRTLAYIIEAGIMYGKHREPNRFIKFGERALMRKHLERLVLNGRVSNKNGEFYMLRDKGGANDREYL